MSFFIKRLTIVGVGLIGGSLAQALREQDLVGEVVGVGRRRSSLELALEMGVIDRFTTNVAEGIKEASVVMMATPVSAIGPIVESFASQLSPGTIITDVGSVKGSIVRYCEKVLPEGCFFVGGHPIAGRERVGVAASFPSLFQGSRTILTPTEDTAPHALELIRLIWEAAGSHVEIMDIDYHDRVLAATSHLPHLMAYNVVNTLSDLEDDLRSEVFRYAASGFRDFTRIASSDPAMWRDICLENRSAIVEILQRFHKDLGKLIGRVDSADADALYGIFARSQKTRERVLKENKRLRGSDS
ncbi:prephenate dehydrogenase [Magnetococcales bacterium HHB-1]